MDKNENDSYG